MSVTIVGAAHLCVGGSRVPRTGKMCNRFPQWEDKAGLGLFRQQSPTDPTMSSPQFPLQQLAHDAHRLGSESEPCEHVLQHLATSPHVTTY
jgi:hypothetical protein